MTDWPRDALTGACLARATPERPVWATLGPLGPLRTWSGQSELRWGISEPFWCCEEHFRSVWIWTCLFRNPILFCKYLSPLISHRNGSVFKIFTWISVFRRKKRVRNPFLSSWDIQKIQKVNFFWDALYVFLHSIFFTIVIYCNRIQYQSNIVKDDWPWWGE